MYATSKCTKVKPNAKSTESGNNDQEKAPRKSHVSGRVTTKILHQQFEMEEKSVYKYVYIILIRVGISISQYMIWAQA